MDQKPSTQQKSALNRTITLISKIVFAALIISPIAYFLLGGLVLSAKEEISFVQALQQTSTTQILFSCFLVVFAVLLCVLFFTRKSKRPVSSH